MSGLGIVVNGGAVLVPLGWPANLAAEVTHAELVEIWEAMRCGTEWRSADGRVFVGNQGASPRVRFVFVSGVSFYVDDVWRRVRAAAEDASR